MELQRKTSKAQFESDTPIVAYHQHDQKSYCLSTLASAFKVSNVLVAENTITTRIYAHLTDAIDDRIQLSNSIVSDQERKFGEQHLRYKL